MLRATAVELQALPIQPLDGNNSLLCTTTTAFVYCLLCLILCTALSRLIMPVKSSCLCILGMHGSCVCRSFNWSAYKHLPLLKHLLARQQEKGKKKKQLQNCFAFIETGPQSLIKFHIILHEHISRNGDRVICESATVKRHWDYHFTIGAGYFLQLRWRKINSKEQ